MCTLYCVGTNSLLELKNKMDKKNISVRSEIGRLRKVLIHSPDGGIGKVVPKKAQELLYEDIVDLTKMQREYDDFVKILLIFLDSDKLTKKVIQSINKSYSKDKRPNFFIPGHKEYFNSKFVLDSQNVLEKLLLNNDIKKEIVTAVCAVESVLHQMDYLCQIESVHELAKILISGYNDEEYLFPPIPNFIFTRDISVTIGEHLLLSKTAYKARGRESILIKYIAREIFGDDKKLISLNEDNDYTLLTEEEQQENRVTIEGGDVMMISDNHLIIGCSERTTPHAILQLVDILFKSKKGQINKVSVIKIPPQRDWMHIDTILSQVKRDMWLMYAPLCSPKQDRVINEIRKELINEDAQNDGGVKVMQFKKLKTEVSTTKFKTVEELCINISREDFGCTDDIDFIYSGGGKFPYDEREQWTDACNLLALKEGVVIGYDRNRKTLEEFKLKGFTIKTAAEIVTAFIKGEFDPNDKENSNLFIKIPSSELSRARGGSHCMSMPLLRDKLK